MTQPTRPGAAERKRLRRAARRELAAAVAIVEDADGLPVLACPHLCEAWSCLLQLHGRSVAATALQDVPLAAAVPIPGLDETELAWLREALPALVDAARAQRSQVEPPPASVDTLRRHARLLHGALVAG